VIKITLKELWARKLRLFTTGIAVLLGVAFMSGTLVLGDTVSKTFDQLFATVNAGTDAFVRGQAAFEDDFGQEQRPRIDESLLPVVASTEGVAVAEGGIEGYAQVVGKDGDAIGNPSNGPPTFGRNWTVDDQLNPFDLVEGRPPEADNEVVIDRFTAKEGDFVVGDTAKVLLQAGAVDVEIVGIASFGDSDSAGGTTNVMFTLPEAQRLIAEPGKLDSISVRADEGVSQEEVRDAIAAEMPEGVEVLTGEEITKENQDAIGEFVSFFSTFLLVFAVIALIVGSFIIYNTFSIIVAQRTREMALFRAVGASRRQVLGSVLLESIIVGVVASLLGLVAGIGVAAGLKSLLAGFGLDVPAGSLVVSATTVIVAFVAGTVVCVASALFPARRASKVPPLAAIRDLSVDRSGRSRVRIVVGILVTGLGVATLFYGLWGNSDNALVLVGLGAFLVIVGVAVLGPVFSAPMARLIGAPVTRLRGISGRLARENATRNPTRTATTASALMIGVALVGFIAILASSIKASIATTVDQAFTGDFVVDSGTFGFGGLPPELADRLNEVPDVEVASGIRLVPMEVEGSGTFVVAVDPETIGELVDVGFVEGGYADLDATSIAVFDETARDEGLSIGDPVPVRFADTGAQELRVGAIYTEDDLAGQYLISHAVAEANVATQFDFQVYVNIAPGVPVETARAAVQQVVDDYPTAELQDRTEFKESQAAQIDPILGLIYVLLAFSVIIAMFGIANTLALSIFERTRELGLLRAVGMTRPQLRSTVRWESVIISLLGTLLGLVIGVFFGWSLVTALSDEGFNTLEIPWATLIAVTLLAAIFGVIAALRPASRAAKLDVLDAMATT
jgi:putative ABC transport system permease protein